MSKVTFDGANKLIIVNYGETSLNVKIDIYSDWKEWVLQSDNSKYELAFSVIGGDQISTGLYLGTTYFLENGWKIRPYEGNHFLTIDGNLYSRDGTSPVIPTVGSYQVVTSLTRSNLIDTVATGGGSSYTLAQIADAVWNKLIVTPVPNSFGEWVSNRLLTVAQYLGMK